MPSPYKYPKSDPNGKFLVVPYKLGFSPFLTSEPFTDSCDECGVISFATLMAIQEKLKAVDKMHILPFHKIITAHEKLLKKIINKKMKGFGSGAFSKEGIEEREHVIYAGNIISNLLDPKPESNEYGLQCDILPELAFDAKSSKTIAKFIQHLPLEANPSIKDQSPALRNFENLTLICEIIFKKQLLLFPVPIFYACEKIPPGCMLGVDYQGDYWSYRGRFTHFKKDGTPIPDYYLTTHLNDYGFGSSSFNKASINKLPQTQFAIDKSGIIFLPKPSANALGNFMNQLPEKHGSQAIILPYIFIIIYNSHISFSIMPYIQEPAVTIALPFELTVSETKLLPTFLHQIYQQGKPYLAILLRALQNATIAEIKTVITYLENFYGNDNFSLTESEIYKEITSPIPSDPKTFPSPQSTQLLYSINPSPLFQKFQKQPVTIEMEEKPRMKFV